MALNRVDGGGGAPRRSLVKSTPSAPPAQPRSFGSATGGTVSRTLGGTAPRTLTSTSGGGGGGGGSAPYSGGGGGGGIAPMGAPMPSVTPPSEEEYFASDQILTAALGALDRALKDYNAQYDTDVGNYDRDYKEGLGNLGWKDQDPGEAENMGWDWNDLLTSSGRAYQNQSNDFANRGMLQSQGYLDAQRLLERSLNDQRGAMETGRADFMGDMGRRKAEFVNQDTLARQQSRAEAAARRAAEYGIV